MALYNAVAETVRNGKELMVEEVTLDTSGEAVITTPYATIDAVTATLKKGTAPTTATLSFSVSGNEVTIHGWMPTAADDTALIASTANETVSVVIIGRRR